MRGPLYRFHFRRTGRTTKQLQMIVRHIENTGESVIYTIPHYGFESYVRTLLKKMTTQTVIAKIKIMAVEEMSRGKIKGYRGKIGIDHTVRDVPDSLYPDLQGRCLTW